MDFETDLQTTTDYKSEDLLRDLQILDESAPELAKRMRGWGDHRPIKTIVRSIQRMLAGDTIVSGEMRVIINMFLYQHRRRIEKYKNLEWIDHLNGTVSSAVDGYKINLLPQTKRRWIVLITNSNDRNHPFPNWQYDLESAKQMALKVLDDAIRWDFEESIGLAYY